MALTKVRGSVWNTEKNIYVNVLDDLSEADQEGIIYVAGSVLVNDGGGGWFKFENSLSRASHDGVNIIDPTSTGSGNGCWIRQQFNNGLDSLPMVIAGSRVTYDNTESGLTASDAQAALDEVAELIAAGVSGSEGAENATELEYMPIAPDESDNVQDAVHWLQNRLNTFMEEYEGSGGQPPVGTLPLNLHSDTKDYSENDLVIYDSKFYRATGDILAKAFDEADWAEVGGSADPNITTRTTVTFKNNIVGQTEFVWPHNATVVEAYLNGSRLIYGDDFTADGSTITLIYPIESVNSVLELISFEVLSLSNVISQKYADARYIKQTEGPLLRFNPAVAYSQNSLVWEQGKVYVAPNAITPGAFDEGEWNILGSDRYVANIAALPLYSENMSFNIHVNGFYEKGDGGGGEFYWDNDEPKSNHNGGTIIDPNKVSELSGGAVTDAYFTAASNGTGCWKRSQPPGVALNVGNGYMLVL